MSMTERISHATVTFAHPFSLLGVDEPLPQGDYAITVTEEQIDGISFVAYRRVATTIEIQSSKTFNTTRQVVDVEPSDLEAALKRDAAASANTAAL
jgi:hypothetical protein